MGNRLSKIVTRTGDDGSTGLGDGTRTAKNSLRVQAIGDVDELNSFLGLLCCEPMPQSVQEELIAIQQELFNLGAELSIPGYHVLADAQIAQLEALMTRYNADLPPLKEFILPGGSRAAALAHVSRTVCRRAERSVVALREVEEVSSQAVQYLNRLSDLLFVLARVLNQHAGKSGYVLAE